MSRIPSSALRRALLPLVAALALLIGGLAPTASAASAAAVTHVVAPTAVRSTQVRIGTIGTKKVKGSAAATVRPSYARGKSVRVLTARLTVKAGKRTVAKNRSSVRLKAGTYRVSTTVRYRVGRGKIHAVKKTQTLRVGRVAAAKKSAKAWVYGSGRNCPAAYPVKGNQSGIYHVPGGRYYKITTPEQCFRDASAARRAGYRASRNG